MSDREKNETNYVVVDLETTGFGKVARITEIGAVKVENSMINGKFESLVNPEIKIPYIVQQKTGITDKMVQSAPVIATILPDFLQFIGNYTLVGHNVAFDYGFIKRACDAIGVPFQNQTIDTLSLARQKLPGLSHHKLEDVCRELSVRNETAHRALSDCLATHACYQKLLALPDSGVSRRTVQKTQISIPKRTVQKTQIPTAKASLTLDVSGKIIVLTGIFEHGSKETIEKFLESKGASIKKVVDDATNIVVIGGKGSNDYKYGSRESKIKKALDLNRTGKHILIVGENDLIR